MSMTSKTLKSARSTPDLKKAERAGREFICKECEQKITETQFIVSKAFLGYQGPAILVREVTNVTFGQPYPQLMRTGAMTVQEAACKDCAAVLGWKIVKAYERTERWKENAILLELDLLDEVDIDLDDVFQGYFNRSSITGPKADERTSLRSGGSSETEDSDPGPKTPTVARFTRLEDGTLVRVGSRLERKASAKRKGLDLKNRKVMAEPVPPSAAGSFFDFNTSDAEEDKSTTQSSTDSTPTIAPPSSPTIHRRVASFEPTATESKLVLPRRPSEPIALAGSSTLITSVASSSLKRSPTSILRSAKPPPTQAVPVVLAAVASTNHHDSLSAEIDQMSRDLQPILEGLPQNADSTPEEIQRKLSATDLPPLPPSETVAEPMSQPQPQPQPQSQPPLTMRSRRPSFRSMSNRPSFAEQGAAVPPLPAGAALHARTGSASSRTHSPKSSISNSPLTTSPVSHTRAPSTSSTTASQVAPAAPASVARTTSTPSTRPPSGSEPTPAPIAAPKPVVATTGVRFEADPTIIGGSTRLERAKVAELTRVLALDGSIEPMLQPPAIPEVHATKPPGAVSATPVAEPVPAPVPAAAAAPLGVPGKTLPFPRAPTPDAALLANRTVRKRALSQPGRRPSLADLQASRKEAEAAMPRRPSVADLQAGRNRKDSDTTVPPAVPRNLSQTSTPSSRANSIVDASGNPVATARPPTMTKRPSMRNLGVAAASASASTSSLPLPVPRKGSVADVSRPTSRATSIIDDDDQPLVVTTRLPAMPARRALQTQDTSRPSSRANSFFESDTATPAKGPTRRPSAADIGASVDAAATSVKNKLSRTTRLFKKIQI